MDAFVINGPAKLSGEVHVHGSKNAALPLLFSSLLFENEIQFRRVPRLWDIETTLSLLESMGSSFEWNKEQGELSILPRIVEPLAGYEWVKKMRAGILALGPLVAKCGRAKVSLPGGCAIGARPVNFHLEALKKMGVEIEVTEGYIFAKTRALQSAKVSFPQVSVTGTSNIMLAASLSNKEVVLENASKEPEVVALGKFLSQCGVKLEGLGTSTLHIQGGALKAPQQPVEIPADRIETGTWIAAAVATDSRLKITGLELGEQTAVLNVFEAMGVVFQKDEPKKTLIVEKARPLGPVEVKTEAYPGFATDMQAQLIAACLMAQGESRVEEAIFENRFMHVAELRRLGASIRVEKNKAIIHGGSPLVGAPVMATDLRASASLVIAALCASGQTRISRIYHLDRGYQRLDESLRRLGVGIERVKES